jgi:4-hydroxy-tetrahydrodipicolinate reductase
MTIRLAVHGAAGRMGQRVVALGASTAGQKVVAALESPGNPRLGNDAGEIAGIGNIGISLSDRLSGESRPEALIDFSVPEALDRVLQLAVENKIPLVLATTGLSKKQEEEVASASHHVAILKASNFSLVVNVLFELTRVAGDMLNGKGFDVEIVERHHRFKKDSPSGTALTFAEIVQRAMGQERIVHGREGIVGERPLGEIGVHAVRVGDNVGEHTVIFSTLGETMELVHKGHSRDSYALGALAAARYLAGKPAGNYSMRDVLGIQG